MNDEPKIPDHRWERRLHDELRRLPDHEAPASLAPNVMAMIRSREAARAREWYRRPYAHWPLAAQWVFGGGLVALFAVLAWGLPTIAAQFADGMQPPPILASWLDRIQTVAEAGRSLMEALVLAANSFFTPARIAIVAVIVISQIALLGIGGSIWHRLMLPQRRRPAPSFLPSL